MNNPAIRLDVVLLAVFLFIALVMVARSARIISQYEKGLVMRLGKYRSTVDSGLTFLVPMIESVIKVDMRERVIKVDPQEVITKDNVMVTVDAVIYYRISDPVNYAFNFANATNLLQHLLDNALNYASCRFTADDALRSRCRTSPTPPPRWRRRTCAT